MNKKILFTGMTAVLTVFAAEAFDSFSEAFKAGQSAENAKKYAEAMTAYAEACKLAPKPNNKYTALFRMAEVNIRQKKWDDAIAKLNEIVSDSAMSPGMKASAQLYIGHVEKWRGNREDAVREYQKAGMLAPQSEYMQNAFNLCGDIRFEEKKYKDALNFYMQGDTLDNPAPMGKAQSCIGMGKVFFEQKKYADALKKFSEADALADEAVKNSKLSANNKLKWKNITAEACLFKGKAEQKLGKTDEAAASLAKAQEQKSPVSYINREISRALAELYVIQGRQLTNQKKYAEAEAVFAKAMAIKDMTYYTRHDLCHAAARCMLNQNKPDEAQKYVDAAPARDDYMRGVNNILNADICIRRSQMAEAIKWAEKNLTLPKISANWKASSYAKIGEVYLYSKDLVKAEEYRKKAQSVPGATWGKNDWLAKAIEKAKK